jgi:hypothetical protein
MMFYGGVVAHNPTGACAKEAIDIPEYEKIALKLEELEDAAVTPDSITGRPILGFTAFPTFRDPQYRKNLKEPYQIRDDFDRTLLDPTSSLSRSIHIVEDKRKTIPFIAQSLLEAKP